MHIYLAANNGLPFVLGTLPLPLCLLVANGLYKLAFADNYQWFNLMQQQWEIGMHRLDLRYWHSLQIPPVLATDTKVFSNVGLDTTGLGTGVLAVLKLLLYAMHRTLDIKLQLEWHQIMPSGSLLNSWHSFSLGCHKFFREFPTSSLSILNLQILLL